MIGINFEFDSQLYKITILAPFVLVIFYHYVRLISVKLFYYYCTIVYKKQISLSHIILRAHTIRSDFLSSIIAVITIIKKLISCQISIIFLFHF